LSKNPENKFINVENKILKLILPTMIMPTVE
jgi:hypothetical protein